MPVTPFHFGPGAVLKGAGGDWFSFGAFALVQVAIDVESGWNMLTGRYPVHDHLHTMPGALLVAALVALAARPGLPPVMRRLRLTLAGVDGYPASLLPSAAPAGWIPIVIGAVLGAVTHVLLDAVIHADARPFGEGNPLYVPGSFIPMHVLCLAAGVVGAGICIARARRAGQGPSRRAASAENPIR